MCNNYTTVYCHSYYISIVRGYVHLFLQLEQEMGLINGRNDTKAKFLKDWISAYVPAILSYGENSSKKGIFSHFRDMDVTGMQYTVLPSCMINIFIMCP